MSVILKASRKSNQSHASAGRQASLGAHRTAFDPVRLQTDRKKMGVPGCGRGFPPVDRLKAFLAEKRMFLLTLLENPNLLEHDRFTDLLWAVTHLDEELEARTSFIGLPDKDLEHLAVDIQRMYDHLASEWLDYVQHLKSRYPYLFSLVLRTHPFQEQQSPIIT